MKFRKIISLTLCICILFGMAGGMVSSAAVASMSISSSVTTRLGYGDVNLTTYTGKYDGKKDLIEALEFTPGAAVMPTLLTGGNNISLNTVPKMASAYASSMKTGQLLGAVNGGFFVYANSNAEGLQIQNGKLLSTNQFNKDNGSTGCKFYTIGFRADGSMFYGIPQFDIRLSCNGSVFTVSQFNQAPQNYETTSLWMLNSDYGSYAKWSTAYSDDYYVLKLKQQAGDYTVGGSVVGTAEDLKRSYAKYTVAEASKCKLEKGYFYLLGLKKNIDKLYAELETSPIATVEFNETSGGDWQNAYTALRGGDLLLKNGEVQYSLDESIKSIYTPRTVVAQKKDGSVAFLVFDSAGVSLSGYGKGLPLVNAAQTLKNMGYVTAVNLDGGTSSAICVKSGSSYVGKNHPLQGTPAVGNALGLVSTLGPGHLISAFESAVFTVSQINCTGALQIYPGGKEHAGNACGKVTYDFSKGGKLDIIFKTPTALPDNTCCLSIRADGEQTGINLAAIYQTATGQKTATVRLSAKGYADYDIPVPAGAEKFIGLSLSKGSGKVSGAVYLDQLRYYTDVKNEDATAPTVTGSLSSKVAKKGTVLSVSAKDDTFGDGVDSNSYGIFINNVRKGTKKYTLTAAPSQVLSKVTFEAADVSGNRTRSFALLHTSAYQPTAYFKDIKAAHWATDAVNYCYFRDLINGTKTNSGRYFYGGKNMTRAEFCATVVRLKNADPKKYASVKLPYADASDIPSWAVNYVKAAYKLGLMTGSVVGGKRYFYPKNNISRAEVCVAIAPLLPTLAGFAPSGTYKDAASIPGWAKSAVEHATAFGIVAGDDTGKFRPASNITRYEIATILMRLYAH